MENIVITLDELEEHFVQTLNAKIASIKNPFSVSFDLTQKDTSPTSPFANALFLKTYDLENIPYFRECPFLCEITIPEPFETLNINAFYGCPLLKSVSLPNSLITIHPNAFGSCTSLQQIEIPASIKYLHEDAFLNCPSLEEIYIDLPKNQFLDSVSHAKAFLSHNKNRITFKDEISLDKLILKSSSIEKIITKIEEVKNYENL